MLINDDTITDLGSLKRAVTRRAEQLGLDCKVLGDGPLHSEIAIIGEAPGVGEIQSGRPFTGASGRFLWDVLRKHGYNRTQFYASNVVKRSLSTYDEDEKVSIDRNELSHYEGLLAWELSQLPNLRIILALGNFALNALSGQNGITSWRGSVLDCTLPNHKEIKLLASYNPAMILRRPETELVFRFDMGRLKTVIDGTWQAHIIKPIINPSPKEAVDWCDKLIDEKHTTALDIEVISGETACVGLANSSHEGLCVNFRDVTRNIYTTADERIIWRSLNKVLASDDGPPLVTQNGGFDASWLWYKDRVHVNPIYFDTLLGHHTLYPRLPHNLGFLTSQYTTHPYYKDEKKEWREGGNIDSFWEYNVKDACITLACMRRIKKELEDQKLDQFFFNHVMRLQPHLIQMTVLGILVDLPLKAQIQRDMEIDLANLLAEFWASVAVATGDSDYRPSPLSTKQLQELFFKKLKLVGRGASTDWDNRQRMLSHPRTSPNAKAVINVLDKYKEEQKFYSTYASSTVDPDNRARCDYKQFGTQKAPGRLSSSSTGWGSGSNLQNQPERAKDFYISDEGYNFIYFDLKQAEAKIVAYIAPVPALKENFVLPEKEPDKYDVHRLNAVRIFGIPYDDVPKKDFDAITLEPTTRYLAKRCVHGLNYGMGIDRLVQETKVSYAQGYKAYHSYHRAFPEIKKWQEATIKEVQQKKELYSLLGRRLIVLERLSDEALESVIAFVPQSTIGDHVSRVIYLCHEDKDWPKLRNGKYEAKAFLHARALLNVHDALVFMAKPEHNELCQAIIQKHAQMPIPIRGEPVSILTDFKFSVPYRTITEMIEGQKVERKIEDGVHRWSTLK